MKRTFAVVLLFLSFASAAFADGSGMEPPVPGTAATQLRASIVQLADGGGGRPPAPPEGNRARIVGVTA
jgi:hypothetical protein